MNSATHQGADFHKATMEHRERIAAIDKIINDLRDLWEQQGSANGAGSVADLDLGDDRVSRRKRTRNNSDDNGTLRLTS